MPTCVTDTVRDRAAARGGSRADAVFEMDEETFRAFYDRTARPLWAYLARMTGSTIRPTICCRKPTTGSCARARHYQGEAHRRNSLFRIATNLAHDRRRRGRGRSSSPCRRERRGCRNSPRPMDVAGDANGAPTSPGDGAAEAARARDALARLRAGLVAPRDRRVAGRQGRQASGCCCSAPGTSSRRCSPRAPGRRRRNARDTRMCARTGRARHARRAALAANGAKPSCGSTSRACAAMRGPRRRCGGVARRTRVRLGRSAGAAVVRWCGGGRRCAPARKRRARRRGRLRSSRESPPRVAIWSPSSLLRAFPAGGARLAPRSDLRPSSARRCRTLALLAARGAGRRLSFLVRCVLASASLLSSARAVTLALDESERAESLSGSPPCSRLPSRGSGPAARRCAVPSARPPRR